MPDEEPTKWKDRGDQYVRQERYEEAIQCYEYAIHLDPEYLSAWNNLGYSLSKLGRKDEAKPIKERISNIKAKQNKSEIITSEEKTSQIQYFAGAWSRFFAYLIDFIILIVLLGIMIGLVFVIFPEFSIFGLLTIILAIFLYWLYFAYFDSGNKQGTLGKQILKLYVTDEMGHQLPLGRSLLRSFLKIIFTLTPVSLLSVINGIIIWNSPQGRGIHDHLANTLVLTNKQTDKVKKSGIQLKGSLGILSIIVIIIVLVIGVIITAAVIAAFVFGMAGSTEGANSIPSDTNELTSGKIIPTTNSGSICGDGYCPVGAICCNGNCYSDPGPDFQIDFRTCRLYPKGATVCGDGFCDGVCCNGKCYEPCPSNYFMANDCNCYEKGGAMWEGPK